MSNRNTRKSCSTWTFLPVMIIAFATPLVALAGVFDALDRLTGPSLGGDIEILDPERAFQFSHEVDARGQLQLNWDIEPGYYLYRDKFKAESADASSSIGALQSPDGEFKDDPEFGRVEVYKHDVSINAPVTPAAATLKETAIKVTYQGCKEDSVCYPPVKKVITVPSDLLIATASASPAPLAVGPAIMSADSIAADLAGHQSLWPVVGTFFVFGLLLALTPCVFPLIPILSGIIVGQGPSLSVARGVGLSAVYVVAVASTYALVGLAAGLFGHNLQATFQHPAVIVAFSAVFVALALSMFGFYELQLPAALQTRLDGYSRAQRGGSVLSVAVMGVLSAIIVGPCVAPPLAGALIYLGHQGNPVTGGLALFALGLGMGSPLLLVGASAGQLLPRAGAWMDRIKHVFGVMLLGVAIWFMERVLPAPLILALWALLLLCVAIYLGAFDRTDASTPPWRRLGKGVGLAMAVYGVVLLVGAAAGAADPFRPLQPLTAGANSTHEAALNFVSIKSVDDLDREVARAAANGQTAMLDFYADWCIECKHLERDTFRDKNVRARLSSWVLLRADVTAHDEIDQALLAHFELFGPPALLFFNTQGEEVRSHRVVGFVEAAPFAEHLAGLSAP